MQVARRYAVSIRVLGKPEDEVRAMAFSSGARMSKADLGKLIKGARISVDAAQSGSAFELPQPRVMLQVPAPGALSEAQMPVMVRRSADPGAEEHLTFTFRGPDGQALHVAPLSAGVTIVAPHAGDTPVETLTLVHAISVLV
jgi:hypothetical protein